MRGGGLWDKGRSATLTVTDIGTAMFSKGLVHLGKDPDLSVGEIGEIKGYDDDDGVYYNMGPYLCLGAACNGKNYESVWINATKDKLFTSRDMWNNKEGQKLSGKVYDWENVVPSVTYLIDNTNKLNGVGLLLHGRDEKLTINLKPIHNHLKDSLLQDNLFSRGFDWRGALYSHNENKYDRNGATFTVKTGLWGNNKILTPLPGLTTDKIERAIGSAKYHLRFGNTSRNLRQNDILKTVLDNEFDMFKQIFISEMQK